METFLTILIVAVLGSVCSIICYLLGRKRGLELGSTQVDRYKTVLDAAGLRLPEDLPERFDENTSGSWTGLKERSPSRPPGSVARFDEQRQDTDDEPLTDAQRWAAGPQPRPREVRPRPEVRRSSVPEEPHGYSAEP